MATDSDYETRILQGRIEKDYWLKENEWAWRVLLFPKEGTSIRLFISTSYPHAPADLAQFFGHQCKVLARGQRADWFRGEASLGKMKALDASNMQIVFEYGSVTAHAGSEVTLSVDDDLKLIEQPSDDLFRQVNQEAEQYLTLKSSRAFTPPRRNPDQPATAFIYQLRPTTKVGTTSLVLTDRAGAVTSQTTVNIMASQF